MFKIIFIDEVEAEINRFQRYAHKEFDVVGKIPLENIDEMVAYILSKNIDAVIADYQLSEYKSAITYTGVELVEKIMQKRANFPCFVMTSYEDSAVSMSLDVNIVYIKGLMSQDDHVKVTFLKRVEHQIIHYKSRISNSQKEFNSLIRESKNHALTAKEETRLLELDHFLEEALNQETKIPSQLKEKSTLKDLHKLIENTDVLLKKLECEDE